MPYLSINIFANTAKLLFYFCIGIAKHFETKTFQVLRSLFIIVHSIRLVMLRSVQFYYNFCLCTIKIYNIRTKLTLPSKLQGISAQKLVP